MRCNYDIAIIGGGIIGLSILRSATLSGLNAILLEKSDHLLSVASGSNSGIVCTGVDASPHSLERKLIRESIKEIRTFCKDHNIPMRQCGSLVSLWSWDDNNNGDETFTVEDKLNEIGKESWDAGDIDDCILTAEEVLEKEPYLNREIKGALHIKGEIVVDPWLFGIAMAVHARENGAEIVTGFEVDADASHFDEDAKIWTIARKQDDRKSCDSFTSDDNSENVSLITAKCIINACGIQADFIQSRIKDIPAPSWTAKPRRGQYRIFSSLQPILTHPIQPMPTQHSKGIFVFSSLYDQIIVGPTAQNQESRTDVTPDESTANHLMEHAQRVLPHLEECMHLGEYVGIRPGTDHRDYQIHCYPHQRYIAAAGIRSTGLTASLGIGRYVIHNLLLDSSVMDITLANNDVSNTMSLTPLPSLQNLVEQFHSSDESVEILGHRYRVTHPITRFGWREKTGLANV